VHSVITIQLFQTNYHPRERESSKHLDVEN
jgi:hypothetical protein